MKNVAEVYTPSRNGSKMDTHVGRCACPAMRRRWWPYLISFLSAKLSFCSWLNHRSCLSKYNVNSFVPDISWHFRILTAIIIFFKSSPCCNNLKSNVFHHLYPHIFDQFSSGIFFNFFWLPYEIPKCSECLPKFLIFSKFADVFPIFSIFFHIIFSEFRYFPQCSIPIPVVFSRTRRTPNLAAAPPSPPRVRGRPPRESVARMEACGAID